MLLLLGLHERGCFCHENAFTIISARRVGIGLSLAPFTEGTVDLHFWLNEEARGLI